LHATCGPPPADLANVYASLTSNPLHKVSSSKVNGDPVVCEGCQWVTTQRGSGKNTVVALKIDQNLKPYNAFDYPAPGHEKVAAAQPEASQPPPPVEAATSTALLNPSAAASDAPGAQSSESPVKEEDSKAVEKGGADFMNSSRPKDFFGGLTSAVKCMGAGFVAGGVALFAAPAVGYKENGIKGFAGGLLQGVVGGAALAAAGVVAGSAQVVRGVVNTPEAMKQGFKQNMKWDNTLGAWVTNTVRSCVVFKAKLHVFLMLIRRCFQVILRDLVAAAEEEAKSGKFFSKCVAVMKSGVSFSFRLQTMLKSAARAALSPGDQSKRRVSTTF
jgi:hypothetical protein